MELLFCSTSRGNGDRVSSRKGMKGENMEKSHTMVISVMDRDRPGIVAEVTECISRLGGNLADLRESVLSGYFTMILVAGFPEEVDVSDVKRALVEATAAQVLVALKQDPLETIVKPEHDYILSAVGRDRVGLVAQVSRYCCEHQINILDLASYVVGDQYTMMLKVNLGHIESIDDFELELTRFGESCGLNLVLQHNDIFKAMNEI